MININLKIKILLLSALAFLFVFPCMGDDLYVAVAANFTGPMQQLSPLFKNRSGHQIIGSYGTVGKFFAQIKNEAPFEVFISSDDTTPKRLVKEGLAISESQFTYAIGKLVLYSVQPGRVDGNGNILRQGGFKRLVIANPKMAVYGAAAVEAMKRMGVYEQLQPKLIIGENITQAYQFVASENAELGFVSLSQIYFDGEYSAGSYWLLPCNLYPPLKQDAILLTKGKNNPAARAFLTFLKSQEARNIIRAYGYEN